MIDAVFYVLVLLFVKHFYVDFVIQTDEQVRGKGIYLNWAGITHSLNHGIGTFIIFFIISDVGTALAVGLVDAVIHYHIDWAKMNINKHKGYTPADPMFWTWLGADQLAHSLTYVWLAWTLS